LTFTSPAVETAQDFVRTLVGEAPNITPETAEFVNTTLYPDNLHGSQGYSTEYDRTRMAVQDVSIVCNTNYLGRAMESDMYARKYSACRLPPLPGQ
jgi:hypothetical protein